MSFVDDNVIGCDIDEHALEGPSSQNLSSSPPRLSGPRLLQHSPPADVSHGDLQRALNDAFSVYALSAKISFTCFRQAIVMFSAVVIDAAPGIVPMISRPGGYFAEINARCPVTETNVDRRLACAKYVIEIAHLLIDELRDAITEKLRGITSPCDQPSPVDVPAFLDIQKLTDTMQMLHLLGTLQLMHTERTTMSRHALDIGERARVENFSATYAPWLYHTTKVAKASHSCVICSTQLAEDVTATSDGSRQQRIVLACCGGNHSICNVCLFKHLLLSSQHGQKSAGSCPMCRHELKIYDREQRQQ